MRVRQHTGTVGSGIEFLMNECMKEEAIYEGNRPVLSKPPRRTYNSFRRPSVEKSGKLRE